MLTALFSPIDLAPLANLSCGNSNAFTCVHVSVPNGKMALQTLLKVHGLSEVMGTCNEGTMRMKCSELMGFVLPVISVMSKNFINHI